MVFVYNKIGDTLNQRRSYVETTPLKSECMSQAYIYKSHTKPSAHWNIMWIKRLDLWYQRQKEEKNIKWPMTDDEQKQWIHKRVISVTKVKASDNMSNSGVYSSLFTTVIWDYLSKSHFLNKNRKFHIFHWQLSFNDIEIRPITDRCDNLNIKFWHVPNFQLRYTQLATVLLHNAFITGRKAINWSNQMVSGR